MNANKKNIFKIILVIFLILFSVTVIRFVRIVPSFVIFVTEVARTIKQLSISDKVYYRQTLNNCAPYAVMGVINVLTQEIKDPEILAQETKWRIMKNLTFPQGLVDLLNKYNINTKEYIMKTYSDHQKRIWLEDQIDLGYPIILLVKVQNIQHYFTVIGYDENGFMLYDSLQERIDETTRKTIVDREEYMGNRYYSHNELIELWNDGGYKIFFRNWAVVCSK
jgi:predicted double-glycine peptidase